MENKDITYMKEAYREAELAFSEAEIPVGAIIEYNGEVISRAHNNREQSKDATGHAEMLAIRAACEKLGGWHLNKCTLYVTLEPCPMCMGAIINSRVGKVVFGAKDYKAGACGSVLNLCSYPLNHKPQIIEGVMKEECAEILTEFFKNKRNL